jgi:hypothetical protein
MQTRIDSLGIKPTVVEEIAEGYEIGRPMVSVTTRRDTIMCVCHLREIILSEAILAYREQHQVE